MHRKQQISRAWAQKNLQSTANWPGYQPSATADWIRYHSGVPWLQLELPVPVPVNTILEEINNIKHLLVEHRDDYGEHQGWRAFCIHGRAYDATREDSYYTDQRIMTWTAEAEEFMPNTVRYFQSWPIDRFHRVRVMALDPGGVISLHSDEPGPGGLGAVNIAITQPDGCDFVVEKWGRIPFQPGAAYMINVSNRHTVVNNSNQTRYHVIAHYQPTQLFDTVLEMSYNKAYASQTDNS